MRSNLVEFIENSPRRWELAKFAIFVVTIMAPMLLLSLYTGRLVPVLFLLFPLGLFYFFPTSFWTNLVLGWFVYIAIITVGTKSKRPRVFILMYVLMIGLLIVNMKGCAVMMSDPSTSTW